MEKTIKKVTQFSQVIDSLRDDLFIRAKNTILIELLCKKYNFDFVEVLNSFEDRDNHSIKLETFCGCLGRWNENDQFELLADHLQKSSTTVTEASQNQTTYVFQKVEKHWIVAKDGIKLKNALAFVDLCSGNLNLPQYRSFDNRSSKTTVIFPLKVHGKLWGVLNMESEKFLGEKYKIRTIGEISQIVQSFERLIEVTLNTKNDFLNTAKALESLTRDINAEIPHSLEKPILFFGYPARGDKEVIGVVQALMEKFKHEVEIYSWSEDLSTGNISVKIIQKIKKSKMAIFYLSQPVDGQDKVFMDNANVLFETGIMTGKENDGPEKSSWIPIREENSGNIPFDFSHNRMIILKRDEQGILLGKIKFERELEAKIKALLES